MSAPREDAPDSLPPPLTYRFADFELDVESGTLRAPHGEIHLRPQAFHLLEVLVGEAPRMLSHQELLDRIWGSQHLSASSLPQAVSELRRALGDPTQGSRLIETVHRRGYRFIAEVTTAGPGSGTETVPLPVQPGRQATTAGGSALGSPARRRALLAGVVAALLLLATVALVWLPGVRPGGPEPAVESTRPVVAVLAFHNLSPGEEAEWLSGALAEMVSMQLLENPALRVLPRESVLPVERSPGRPAERVVTAETAGRLRRALGADLMVLGSYLVVGTQPTRRLQIHLRVEDTERRETVCSLTATGFEADLLELATDLGRRLRRRLTADAGPAPEQAGLAVALSGDLPAVERYFAGLAKLRSFEPLAARQLLQEAVAADPSSPLAHWALAQAWQALGYDREARREAGEALTRSDPLSREERLLIEALYRSLDGQRQEAVDLYRSLFTFFPDNLEYGLRLAGAQVAAGQAAAARETLAALRRLPGSAGSDPRIELADAEAAAALSDFEGQLACAGVAAARGEELELPLLVGAARLLEGQALQGLGRPEEAETRLEEARDRFQAAGDRWRLSEALSLQARSRLLAGRFDDAGGLLAQAEELSRELGNQRGLASTLQSLAIVRVRQGSTLEGRRHLERAAEIYDAIGDRLGRAKAQANLAGLLEEEGDLAAAESMLARSLEIFRQAGQKQSQAGALVNLGKVRAKMGKRAQGKEAMAAARALFAEIGDRHGEALAVSNLAAMASLEGALEESARQHREALAIFRRLDAPSDVARVLFNLGLAAQRRGELGEARALLSEALATYRRLGEAAPRVRVLIQLGEVELWRGDVAAARPLLDEALAHSRELSDPYDEAFALSALAHLDELRGELAAARRRYGEALALRRQMGAAHLLLRSRTALAYLSWLAGEAPRAEREIRLGIGDGAPAAPASDAAAAHLLLARLLAGRGAEAEARDALARAREGLRADPNYVLEQEAVVVAAVIAAAEGRGPEAAETLEGVRRQAEERGFVTLALETEITLAEVELAAPSPEAGRRRLARVAAAAGERGLDGLARGGGEEDTREWGATAPPG